MEEWIYKNGNNNFHKIKTKGNYNILDILMETISPDDIDISSIQMHNTLNLQIWESEEKIKTEIRKILLMNAKRFIEFCNLENLKFDDIVLTGSMANYNYNENSDIDVHIILDFNQISSNDEFVNDFLKTKKQLWEEKLPIQIKGHDVEMYFQNSTESHHSTGIYSLIKDRWIRKPLKKIINIDCTNIRLKASDIMNAIDDLESNIYQKDFLNKYEELKNKIKRYRQAGLDKSGEYSTENLVFKILRNSGYLEKMVKLKNNYLVGELSLNEFKQKNT